MTDEIRDRLHRWAEAWKARWAGEVSKRVAEIRARCDAATPGPWQGGSSTVGAEGMFGLWQWYSADDRPTAPADAAFIAHARTDVPDLLEALQIARDLLTRAMPQVTFGQPDRDREQWEREVEAFLGPVADPRVAEVVDVSAPGAALRVSEIVLTEEGRRGLEVTRG